METLNSFFRKIVRLLRKQKKVQIFKNKIKPYPISKDKDDFPVLNDLRQIEKNICLNQPADKKFKTRRINNRISSRVKDNLPPLKHEQDQKNLSPIKIKKFNKDMINLK